MDDGMLTVAEVAARLRVSEETVRRQCRNNRWKSVKIGRLWRFTPEQFEEIVNPPQPERTPRNQRDYIRKLMKGVTV